MRKELLLGTTALLVGAIAAPEYVSAAEPLRLSVRGYKNEYFGLGDADDDTNSGITGPTAHFSDGEVHFRGETTLDNGLTVGVQIELEAFASGDQIDEAYSWVSGDFGKLTVGGENLEGYQMLWGGTAPNVGVPINSGWITVFTSQPAGSNLGFRRTGLTTNATLTNDTFHIRYRSPRFAGFQFGASYAPTEATSGSPKNFPGLVDEDVEIHDIFDVGLNFSESFNGFDVYLVGVYERGTLDDTRDGSGFSDCDDPQILKGGVNLGFAGFSVGGSYANQFDGVCSVTTTVTTKTDSFLAEFEELSDLTLAAAAAAASSSTSVTSTEGQAWDVGASYSTGPWSVSGTWFHGEEEGSTADGGDDEVDAFVGAVSYALGPGITTSVSGYYAKFDNEDGVESDSILGILGLAISF